MIVLVTGPPGSGKTYYTCRLIEQAAREGRFVATNVRLVDGWAERMVKGSWRTRSKKARARRVAELRSRVVYVQSLGELSAVKLDTKGWEKNLEGRGVAVFDEAGSELDSRDWNSDKDRRKADNNFMKQHRKAGWDVYLVCQEAEQLDTRTRGLAEYEYRLRNLKRVKVCTWLAGGFPLWPFGNLFMVVKDWKTTAKAMPQGRETFTLSKRIAGLYDTHQVVYDFQGDELAPLPARAEPAGTMLTVAELRAAAAAPPDSPGRPATAAPARKAKPRTGAPASGRTREPDVAANGPQRSGPANEGPDRPKGHEGPQRRPGGPQTIVSGLRRTPPSPAAVPEGAERP